MLPAIDVANRIRTAFSDLSTDPNNDDRHIWRWSRKPDAWNSPIHAVPAHKLREADPLAFDCVPVFSLAQLYGDDEVFSSTPWSDQKADFRETSHLAKDDAYTHYQTDPDQVTVYIIDARQRDGGYILVNSEAYEYIRYAVRLEDYIPSMRGKVTAHPVDMQIPGDILLDIARVLHRGSIGTSIGGDRASTILDWLKNNAPQIITDERLVDYDD